MSKVRQGCFHVHAIFRHSPWKYALHHSKHFPRNSTNTNVSAYHARGRGWVSTQPLIDYKRKSQELRLPVLSFSSDVGRVHLAPENVLQQRNLVIQNIPPMIQVGTESIDVVTGMSVDFSDTTIYPDVGVSGYTEGSLAGTNGERGTWFGLVEAW